MTTRSATRSTRSITVPTSCGSNARIDSTSHRGHDHEDTVTPSGRHAGASPITESGPDPDPVLVDTARFDLDARARTAISQLADTDWDQVLDHRGRPRDPDDAGVAELTGLLRRSAGGDRLATWPRDMRIICRR